MYLFLTIQNTFFSDVLFFFERKRNQSNIITAADRIAGASPPDLLQKAADVHLQ